MVEVTGVQPEPHDQPTQPNTRATIARAVLFLHDSRLSLPHYLAEPAQRVWEMKGTPEELEERLFSDETVRSFHPDDLPTREMLLQELKRKATSPRLPLTRQEGMAMIEDESKWEGLLEKLMKDTRTLNNSAKESQRAGIPPSHRTGELLALQGELMVPLIQLLDPTLHR